jgi:N-acetylneuraminate synthase
MKEVFVICEIGINGNGSILDTFKLIEEAKEAGCDAVKFQKRNVDLLFGGDEYKDKTKETPWGTLPYLEYKHRLEFEKEGYDEINDFCNSVGIDWFASAWDLDSQKFLQQYNLKYNKIASAMLTNIDLVNMVADEGKYTFVSTGMSTVKEIEKTVNIFKEKECPFELMHCNSTYPLNPKDANLLSIPYLRGKFNCKVGYSGHEIGLPICVAAVALGATSIERHITLDRAMWGSDQSASIEPQGLKKLVKYIRTIEDALGKKGKFVTKEEEKIKNKLRR